MSTLMQRLMAAKLAKSAPLKIDARPHPGKADMNDPRPSPVPFRFPAAAPPEERACVEAAAVGAPRGSCKAINAETGRQCALLAGHTKPHRHGSTEFTRVAVPGQQHFTRRDALDSAAASRSNHQGEVP